MFRKLDKDYFLTRCMCNDRKRFKDAEVLFSDTHPVLYLRIASIVKKVFGPEGISVSELSEPGQERLFARMTMLEHLTETPSKIALGACLLRNITAFDATKNLIMDYPAIEGFFTEQGSQYSGVPPQEILFDIWEHCLKPTP